MIKKCLKKLLETKIDIGEKRKDTIKLYLEKYDEDILFNIMRGNLGLIAEDINLYYYQNVGFRCSNDVQAYGRLPICNIIQKILNEEYRKLKEEERLTENKEVNSQMYYMLEKLKNL
ncbi:MAG: hypothetical protein ACOC3V_01230 [bacterium]